jgi:hypothetical protein
VGGILFLCATCLMRCHSSCSCVSRGRENIRWMRNRYAAILCSWGWLDKKLIVVSVTVGFWYIPSLRKGGFLVMVRCRKLIELLISMVGVSWMLLCKELT